MTMTALKSWVNLEVLTHTDLNLYIGSGGNLSHLFAELATGAGQIPYATGSKAVAVLAAGTAGQYLRSGGAGAPTWSNAKRVSVYRSTTQSLTDSTLQAISFDTELSDPDAWHDPASNPSRITVPSGHAGVVLIRGQITFTGNATGARGVVLLKGGATSLIQKYVNNAGAAINLGVEVAFVDIAAAGDYYEIQGYQASGGALNTIAGRENTHLQAILMPGAA